MTENQNDAHLRVDIIGADQRTLNAFQMAFMGPGKNQLSIVNATVAEALIVDLDGHESANMWREYRSQFPNRPTVVITSSKTALDSSISVLYKPLDINLLLERLLQIQKKLYADEFHEISDTRPGKRFLNEAMAQTVKIQLEKTNEVIRTSQTMSGYEKRLSDSIDIALDVYTDQPTEIEYESTQLIQNNPTNSINSQSVTIEDTKTEPDTTLVEFTEMIQPMDKFSLMGNTEDKSFDELEKDTSLYIRINNYLLGIFQATLKAAVKNRVSACLTVADNKIFILPLKDEIWVKKGKNPLHLFCPKPIERRYAKVNVHERPPETNDNYEVESTSAFLWKLAAWTYRGRLPMGTDIKSRIYLAHWPNFTRLMPIPNAMRISTLWTEQSMPLTFTAEALSIPQRNVFALYSASYTIGLSGQARRESDNLFLPGALV